MMNNRLILVTPWFGEHMGYIENSLPRALGALGVDVHVLTTRLQPHFSRADYATHYEPWNGPAIQPVGVSERDGFTVHRLPDMAVAGQVGIRGIGRALRNLNPDVVQVLSPVSLTTLQTVAVQRQLRFRLFTGAHRAAITFATDYSWGPRNALRRAGVRVTRTVPGAILSLPVQKCFSVAPDCTDVAVQYFGVPRSKIVYSPLGVDTSLFHPPGDQAERRRRYRLRTDLGYGDSSIVCVHSGYLSADKGVQDLAAAVANLSARGLPYRALFIGGGPEAESLRGFPGTTVLPFVPWPDLADLYRAADIAVWPRSYSISQLDAVACGLPVVLSGDVKARERYAGIGHQISPGNVPELEEALLSLSDSAARRELGNRGAQRMRERFSWLTIARQRMQFYGLSAHR